MLGHDPAAPLKQPIDVAQLKDFIKMVHPDAMTLIVVGNVDSRSVAEQINKTFGDLKGKRETPQRCRPYRRCLPCRSAS